MYCQNKCLTGPVLQGKQFDCVDDIEECFREDSLLSVADFLGNLHQQCWEDENAFSSVNFWKQQVCACVCVCVCP